MGLLLTVLLIFLLNGVLGEPVLSLYLQPPNPYHPLINHSSHPIFNTESIEETKMNDNIPLVTQESNKHTEINQINPIPINNQIRNDQAYHLIDHRTDRTAQESNYGPPQGQSYYGSPNEQKQQINNNHPNHFQHHPNYHTLNPFQTQQHNRYGPPAKQPRTIKYVSVFVAPQPPPSYNEPQRIKIQGEAEKQVNIIFIKNPSSQNGPAAEVDLPPNPEQKTVVYVLNEKRSGAPQIKVNNPRPSQPHKPDVFFVQYKNQQHNPVEYGAPNLEYPSQQHDEHNFNYYSSSSSSQATTHKNNNDALSSYSESKPIQSTYAPSMSHDTYNVLSKREINDDKATKSADSGAGSKNYDFRPYRYAPNMDHRYYGVIGLQNRN